MLVNEAWEGTELDLQLEFWDWAANCYSLSFLLDLISGNVGVKYFD